MNRATTTAVLLLRATALLSCALHASCGSQSIAETGAEHATDEIGRPVLARGPADVTGIATWSSSCPPSDGTVTGGLVDLVDVGSCVVTATVGDISASTDVTIEPPDPFLLTISPINPAIPLGAQVQLEASLTFTDGSVIDVTGAATWISSDTTVATVATGLVTGVGSGTAQITASIPGLMGMDTVTVGFMWDPPIAITPENPTIVVGTTIQLTATGTYTDGSTQDLTDVATWTSSDTSIATVSIGLVTGVVPGRVTITASAGNVPPGSTTVTVIAAPMDGGSDAGPDAGSGCVSSMDCGPCAVCVAGRCIDTPCLPDAGALDAGADDAGSEDAGAADAGADDAGYEDAGTADAGADDAGSEENDAGTRNMLTISCATNTVCGNQTDQCTATEESAGGVVTDVSAVWWTSNPTAMSINASGDLTCYVPGSYRVSASADGLLATTLITCSPASVTSLAIAPTDPTLPLGLAQALTVTATYCDGSTVDATFVAAWTSSDDSIASISSRGIVTAAGEGSATITASFGGETVTTQVTVTGPVLAVLQITSAGACGSCSNGTCTNASGVTLVLAAMGTYTDGTIWDISEDVTWGGTCSGTQGASGHYDIGPDLANDCTVNATSDPGTTGNALTTSVSVTPGPSGPLPLVSIALTPDNPTLSLPSTLQLISTGTYCDGTTARLTSGIWITSDPTVATVDASGLVRSVAPGMTTITYKVRTLTGTTDVTVICTSCQGVCVDEQTDVNNCGGCGSPCPSTDPNGAASCSAGLCTTTCRAGFTFCRGVCVDAQNDPSNCGTCGNVCEHGCTNGACTCVPDCSGRTCGDDGCGGTCGTCPVDAGPMGDAGSAPFDAGAPPDAGVGSDAGSGSPDASAPADAGETAAAGDAGSDAGSTSLGVHPGCGCSSGGDSLPMSLVLLQAFIVLRRRRGADCHSRWSERSVI